MKKQNKIASFLCQLAMVITNVIIMWIGVFGSLWAVNYFQPTGFFENLIAIILIVVFLTTCIAIGSCIVYSNPFEYKEVKNEKTKQR